MSQNDHPQLSLLSLSIAAASAPPIDSSQPAEYSPRPLQGAGNNTTTKHRRLSSAGRSRRRLSDARDAATRPSPAFLQTASTLSSLAALSISSPTLSTRFVSGTQPMQVPANSTKETFDHGSIDDKELSTSLPQASGSLTTNSPNVAKNGRKRGTIFTCESCSKVYRHPSCLIKHRWEHTPQWREASKFVLSKHQQVQLLEAAAILSHLSPSSASLPEDRSLWPSFLSGGLVPPPAPENEANPPQTSRSPSSVHSSFPVSSSVPATSILGPKRSESTGPRLHNYSFPDSNGTAGITQVRPGMLGASTTASPGAPSSPVPVPVPAQTTTDDALNLLALHSASVRSESWGSPPSSSAFYEMSLSSRHRRYAHAPSENNWSLPRSCLRSMSGSSHSRSASESKSEEEEDDEREGEGGLAHVDLDLGGMMNGARVYGLSVRGARYGWKMEDEDGVAGLSVREEDEEQDGKVGVKMGMGMGGQGEEQRWDGMEMEMEMD